MALTDGIKNKLKVVANAIRSKTNKSGNLTLEQMASEVSDIDTLQGLNFEDIFDQEQADEINQYYKDGIAYAKEILNTWVKPTTLRYAFSNKHDIVYLPNIDLSGISNCEYMMLRCYSLLFFERELNDAILMNYTFHYCGSIKWCKITTPNVTSMVSTFHNCFNLQVCEISDVSQVTDFTNIFSSAYGLVRLRMSKWKTGNISTDYQNNIEDDSIKYLIYHAINIADGASNRDLTLHATTYKNWNNFKDATPTEADKKILGVEDLGEYATMTWSYIASEIKGITIKSA